ncbi:MAG: hypothetical protein MK212_03145 [Saprospiraceae bacterium]|nr:hypothetical protein [Saprospiraceae bacterium]
MSKPFKIFLGVILTLIVSVLIWMIIDSIIKRNEENKIEAILNERGVDPCRLMQQELMPLCMDPKVQEAAGVDLNDKGAAPNNEADFGDAINVLTDLSNLRHEAAKEYLRREGIDESLAAALNRLTLSACLGQAFDQLKSMDR